MRKLHFYGIEDKVGKGFLYQFPYLQGLDAWIREKPFMSADGEGRYQVKATDSEVRRTLRRMAVDPKLTFPVEID